MSGAPVTLPLAPAELGILHSAISRHCSYLAFANDPPSLAAAELLRDRVEQLWSQPARFARVLVTVEGGAVTGILSEFPMEWVSVDYDIEGISNTDESFDIPSDDGQAKEALRYAGETTVDSEFIERALAAPLAFHRDDWEPEDLFERWVKCTMPSRPEQECWQFSATFAWQGDQHAVAGMLPAEKQSDALDTLQRGLQAAYGEVSKLDVTWRAPEGGAA